MSCPTMPRAAIRRAFLGACAAVLMAGAPAQPLEAESMPYVPADHPIPLDKGITADDLARLRERGAPRVYRGDERLTIGMPCGGVAAGQLYVRGDGTLACWQIDGGLYFSGVGHTCYRTYRPESPVQQGFAVATRDADGRPARAVLSDAGYDAIEFIGEYPRAIVHYRARNRAVPPVDVDLEVFSPFIPLDARRSAWPATVLRFTVTNRTRQAVDVALGGWLQNLVFSEQLSPLTITRRNRARTGSNVTGVFMDAMEIDLPVPTSPQTRVLGDFESGTYAGWTARGTAFGDSPARGTEGDQQAVSGYQGDRLINTFSATQGDAPTGTLVSDPFVIDQPFLTFLIGGGAHAGRTCMNLVVHGQAVRTATGTNSERLERRAWDVRGLAGRTAHLEILDEHSGGWGHINVDDIRLTNVVPEELREFSPEALGNGNVALHVVGEGVAAVQLEDGPAILDAPAPAGTGGAAAEGGFDTPLVGGVRRDFRLEPGAAQDVTFIVSWYFPNLHTQNGRMYTNWFSDAGDVARQLAADLDELRAKTVRFCDRYYRETTLPWWLNARLLMPVANLATGTAQWWANGRFWGWEGVCCCHGTCTHVWNYAQAHAWLFPELSHSVRVMQDLGEGFESSTGLVGFRSDRNFAADGQAGTILKCYRQHLMAADDAFLRKYWRSIQFALDYLVEQDGDGNGVIENDLQHNTYDINFVGPNTFVGSLYIAALEAGAAMAERMQDAGTAQRYRALAERGRRWTAEHLFNGEYFVQQIPPGNGRPWQYGTGCLSDQLFGQNWAHGLGMGYVYPREQIRSALAAVYRYNWTPDVGPLNEKYPPERWFARPGEPGLLLCTWPRGGRPAEPVRYRDEVWSGIEYQVAAGLIWEGMVDEALAIVHGIDERYDGARHNPWNEVECGDHYARALASWGVLHALAGFTFDGPAGRLTIAPRMQADDFACFFAAGTGWGTLRQRRAGDRQVNEVEVAAGTLRLCEIGTQVPEGVRLRAVAARIAPAGGGVEAQRAAAGSAVDATWVEDDGGGGRCTVRLRAPAELRAGQKLTIEITTDGAAR